MLPQRFGGADSDARQLDLFLTIHLDYPFSWERLGRAGISCLSGRGPRVAASIFDRDGHWKTRPLRGSRGDVEFLHMMGQCLDALPSLAAASFKRPGRTITCCSGGMVWARSTHSGDPITATIK